MTEHASSHSKSSERSLKDAPLPPLPFEKHLKKVESKSKKEQNFPSPSEELKMIKDMQRKNDELKAELEKIYDQTGWTPHYLDSYLGNPNNLTPEQWKKAEERRLEFMEAVNIPLQTKQQGSIFSLSKKSTKTTNSERKSKVRGARKNWLPMR